MPLKDRQAVMRKIEKLRGKRRLVAICNFDRASDPSSLPGLSIQFQEDMKEPLFRVLKETLKGAGKLDVFLYTRGGATNAVWPIVSLIREFDPDFEVLIPYRAHSSGTMLALAARKMVMTNLSELSPIDPTTANQFNPRDAVNTQAMLGIAGEDVTAYQEFWKGIIDFSKDDGVSADNKFGTFHSHMNRLATEIHPLALGNVHRSYMQIRVLAKMLLAHQYDSDKKTLTKIIDALTKGYYSHNHMINRHEALELFSKDHISFADEDLSNELDNLLRSYENDFMMRHQFSLARFIADDTEKEARFVGGAVESSKWSYLNETSIRFRQYLAPPSGVQIQVPPGTIAPLVPGLPRKYEWQIVDQGWRRNTKPKGVTLC